MRRWFDVDQHVARGVGGAANWRTTFAGVEIDEIDLGIGVADGDELAVVAELGRGCARRRAEGARLAARRCAPKTWTLPSPVLATIRPLASKPTLNDGAAASVEGSPAAAVARFHRMTLPSRAAQQPGCRRSTAQGRRPRRMAAQDAEARRPSGVPQPHRAVGALLASTAAVGREVSATTAPWWPVRRRVRVPAATSQMRP